MTAKPARRDGGSSDFGELPIKAPRIVVEVQGIHRISSVDDIFYGACEFQAHATNQPTADIQDLASSAEFFDNSHHLKPYLLYMILSCLEQDKRSNLGCNISTNYLTAPEAWFDLVKLLEKRTHLANRLVIELSESTLLSDMGSAQSAIGFLRGLGCRVVFNNFGTGFFTPLTLACLDMNCVKIDARLMMQARKCSKAKDSLSRTIDYVRRFAPIVILDGVETAEDFLIAKASRATHARGKFLSSPVDLISVYGMNYV